MSFYLISRKSLEIGGNNMFKILAGVPFPEDGTSRYRAYGALNQMRQWGIEIVPIPPQVKWYHLEAVDAVFLQRAFLPWQVQLEAAAKAVGIPVWTDYDDFLLGVTKDNPTSDSYNADQSKQNVETCIKLSDLVTVSTEALREQLLPFNQNVHVVANGLDMKILNPLSNDIPRNPIVMWRGGHSHDRDLRTHADAILSAYEKNPDWSFCFMGWNPWYITEKMQANRVRYIPFSGEYVPYMKNLQKMRAAIHIVPLADNTFNRCKSRIAHLESAFAGSVCLAPAWKEWEGGECVHYEGVQDFENQLLNLMAAPLNKLGEQANRSWSWVTANRTLHYSNVKRRELFKKYLGMKEK